MAVFIGGRLCEPNLLDSNVILNITKTNKKTAVDDLRPRFAFVYEFMKLIEWLNWQNYLHKLQ